MDHISWSRELDHFILRVTKYKRYHHRIKCEISLKEKKSVNTLCLICENLCDSFVTNDITIYHVYCKEIWMAVCNPRRTSNFLLQANAKEVQGTFE